MSLMKAKASAERDMVGGGKKYWKFQEKLANIGVIMKNEKVNLYSKIVDMECPKVKLSKVDLN